MTKSYHDKPVNEWNVKDMHAWLIDENARRFDAEYTPMGHGSKSQRWRMEQGMLKQALQKHGGETLKRWLDEELGNYRSTTQYPALTFGFAYSYRDRSLARVAAEEKKREKRGEELTVDEMIDLL